MLQSPYRHRNDQKCVQWDVKPCSLQSDIISNVWKLEQLCSYLHVPQFHHQLRWFLVKRVSCNATVLVHLDACVVVRVRVIRRNRLEATGTKVRGRHSATAMAATTTILFVMIISSVLAGVTDHTSKTWPSPCKRRPHLMTTQAAVVWITLATTGTCRPLTRSVIPIHLCSRRPPANWLSSRSLYVIRVSCAMTRLTDAGDVLVSENRRIHVRDSTDWCPTCRTSATLPRPRSSHVLPASARTSSSTSDCSAVHKWTV